MPSAAPTDNQTPRRPSGRLRILAAAVCALLLALGALRLSLPWLAARLAVPMLASALHVPHLDVDVRRVDFSGLDIGGITLGDQGGIRTRAVLVDWSLTGLVRGELDGIRILGLEVLLRKRGDAWQIPGLPTAGTDAGEDAGAAFLPRLKDIHVDGALRVEDEATKLSIPFEAAGSLEPSGALNIEARALPAGQELRLGLDADLSRREYRVRCSAPEASVAALSSMIPGMDRHALAGSVALEAEGSISQEAGSTLRAGLTAASIQAASGATLIRQDGETTAELAWKDALNATLSPLRLAGPLQMVVTFGGVTADLQRGVIGCTWDAELPAPTDDADASLVRIHGRTDAIRRERGWDVRTEAETTALTAALRDMRATLEPSTLIAEISLENDAASLAARISLGRLRLARNATTVTLSGLSAACNATSRSGSLRGTLDITGGRLEARGPGQSFTSTALGANVVFDAGEQPGASGRVFAAGRFRSGDFGGSMRLNLPLNWPTPSPAAGSVAADVNWSGKSLAKISGTVAQKMHGFALAGSLSLPPAGLRASIRGGLDISSPADSWLEMTCAQELSLPGGLPRFAPALASLSGTARLDASARLEFGRGVPELPVKMRLTGLDLTHGKSKVTMQGGAVELAFGDVLTFRSEPDQRATFESLQLGTILLEKGDVRYQVEAPHSILVESCAFRWAGGRVGTQAFRINPGVENYTVELYCDRVGLAQALGQLGMSQAQGGGSANGRIPVHWAGGSLTFDNGFLYSTPGEKGVLRIQGTEILTAGVPPGTPQYGQLDLAAEALKDFSYEWAKIRMNTEERELVVSLELDGKPAGPLPFTYNRDIGGFARVSASSPGSVFQGIRLDVNFRLPLDQLLQYRQILELMNNGG